MDDINVPKRNQKIGQKVNVSVSYTLHKKVDRI